MLGDGVGLGTSEFSLLLLLFPPPRPLASPPIHPFLSLPSLFTLFPFSPLETDLFCFIFARSKRRGGGLNFDNRRSIMTFGLRAKSDVFSEQPSAGGQWREMVSGFVSRLVPTLSFFPGFSN